MRRTAAPPVGRTVTLTPPAPRQPVPAGRARGAGPAGGLAPLIPLAWPAPGRRSLDRTWVAAGAVRSGGEQGAGHEVGPERREDGQVEQAGGRHDRRVVALTE